MNLIEENPFRILGVISNASAKEIKEAETYIIRYLDVGKSAELKFDISPPLKKINRTSNLVSNAKSQIHSNFDKLSFAIFWFVNGSSIDKIALKKLSETRDLKSASETFKKGSRDFSVSKSTFASIINYSTLEILTFFKEKDEESLKKSLKFKFDVVNNIKAFKLFENLVTSEAGKINHKDFVNRYIENVKLLLKEFLPKKNQNKLLSEIFSHDKNIFGDIEETMINSLLESITEKLNPLKELFIKQRQKTESQIVSSKSVIIKRLNSIINDTKSEYNHLLELTSKNDFRYINKLNELYELVNGLVVMVFNIEQQKAIDAVKYGMDSTIRSISFAAYVKVLREAKKSLSGVDCAIKSRLLQNFKVISDMNDQLLDVKRKMNDSFSGPPFISPSGGYSPNTSSEENGGCFAIGFIIFIIYLIWMANS